MNLYDNFHKSVKLQKRIIDNGNFTYCYLLEIIKSVKLKGLSVIDIGCGTGALDFYFASKGAKVIGIDISKNAIRIARKNAINFGLSNSVKFSTRKFPMSDMDRKFNLAICSEILEHLKDDLQAVKAVHKLLNSNGLVIFASPSANSPLYKLGLTKNHDELAGHLRRYKPESLDSLIRCAGFKIIRMYKKQGIFRELIYLFRPFRFMVRLANKFRIISSILTTIDNMFLFLGESDIIVIAQKK